MREVTLLGQNVNAYRGKLGGGTGDAGIADFAMLLEHVAEIPGIARIRYSTSHPREFSQRLIDLHARLPMLGSHVHLPVQSGSDRVLAAMKRGYTALEYKAIIRRLRTARPDVCVSSDFIVGFPGETEADFAATLRFAEEIGFDGSYCFIYSRRPGTPASDLADDTPHELKLQRLARLQTLVDANAAAISRRMVGSDQLVLIDGASNRNAAELTGRTDNNRVVNFPGNTASIGEFANIRITAAASHSLRGERITDRADLAAG